MKNIFFFMLALIVVLSACTDKELDPLQTDKITKGAVLALRGTAYANLDDAVRFAGAMDTISKSQDVTKQDLEFEADVISADNNNIANVEVFALANEKAPRIKIGTVDGSKFAVPKDGKYTRASFNFPMGGILKALGVEAANLEVGSYINIECDLNLKDGKKIAASAITNPSLFESELFYPAHKMLVLVKK